MRQAAAAFRPIVISCPFAAGNARAPPLWPLAPRGWLVAFGRRAGLRQVQRGRAPLSIGQIGLVSGDGAAMPLSSGWPCLEKPRAQRTALGYRQLAPPDRSPPTMPIRSAPTTSIGGAAGPADQRRSQGDRRRVVRLSQEAAGNRLREKETLETLGESHLLRGSSAGSRELCL